MENEQMNQQPTYEQLAQAYNSLVRENESVKMELAALKTDKLLDKLKLLLSIAENKDKYPKSVYNLAKWNLEQILAKSKN